MKPEHRRQLLLMAASRAQDLADVSRMLGGGADDTAVEEARRVLARHRPQDQDAGDLDRLIRLGKLEHEAASHIPGPGPGA